MRAKEFSRLLFDTIHEAVGLPPVKTFPGYTPLEYFCICDDKEKPLAHIGWEGYDHGSMVGVWDDELFDPSSKVRRLSDPFLEIRGGVRRAGVWTYGRGDLLREDTWIRSGGKFYFRDIDLRSPVVRVIGEVLNLAYQLSHEAQLPPLSYWEAFRNPDRDFTKPN